MDIHICRVIPVIAERPGAHFNHVLHLCDQVFIKSGLVNELRRNLTMTSFLKVLSKSDIKLGLVDKVTR